MLTAGFPTTRSVRQGDVRSQTLSSLFVNDLALAVKRLNRGVRVGQNKFCILFYADDIVVWAENEHDLQEMHSLHSWCRKWRMHKYLKTNIVHFRNRRTLMTNFHFSCGGITLDVVDSYKYLGIYLDAFLKFKPVLEFLVIPLVELWMLLMPIKFKKLSFRSLSYI